MPKDESWVGRAEPRERRVLDVRGLVEALENMVWGTLFKEGLTQEAYFVDGGYFKVTLGRVDTISVHSTPVSLGEEIFVDELVRKGDEWYLESTTGEKEGDTPFFGRSVMEFEEIGEGCRDFFKRQWENYKSK